MAYLYLKKIEIYGFKSFAEKIELEFKDGITAIVGPNGSGKSNIADAVRWVLGEQSVKSLRGSKMEDIIFAGTQKRKPLGYAEVSLVIDNTSGKLPIDFNEVRITRRVFRSGESEFYINKSSCRLKDIHQLFMDTGLGKEGYSIIGQGRIDDILSANSLDRRSIFEEAAGIVKYKSRKSEAEKKLEKTQQNLIRIVDITNELEKQIEPLRFQAKKAKDYLSLKEKLKGKELALFIHRMDLLQEKHSSVMRNKENINLEILEKEVEIKREDKNIFELKSNLKEIEDKIDSNQSQLYRIRSEVEKKQSEIKLYQERIDNLLENKGRVFQEITTSKEDANKLQEEMKRKEVDLNQLSKLIEIQTSEIEGEKAKYNEMRDMQKEKEKDIEEGRQQKFHFINHLSELKSSLNGISIMSNNIARQIDSLHSVNRGLEEDLKLNSSNKREVEIELEQNNTEIKKLEAECRTLNEKLSHINLQLENIKDSISKKNKELQIRYSRCKVLEEMELDYDGYYNSVKKLMGERKKDKFLYENIYGVVAELIKVPSEYTIAIEKALGSSLQNIVVKDEHVAEVCIRLLNKNKWGRATFLPLAVIRGSILTNERQVLNNSKGFLGIASDLIYYKEFYRDVVEYLLGRVAIVEDMKVGIDLSRKLKHRIKVVTKDGEVFNPGGSIVGGNSTSYSMGILSRQQELAKLSRESEECKQELTVLNKKLQSLERLKEDFLKKQAIAMDEINTKEKERIGLKKAYEQIMNEGKRIGAEMAKNKKDIEVFNLELIELKNKKDNIEIEIAEVKERISIIDVELQRSNDINQEDREKIEELTSIIRHLEVELAKNHQKYSDFESHLTQIRSNLVQITENMDKKEQSIKNYDRQISEYNSRINELSRSIQEARELLGKLENEQSTHLQKKEGIKEEIQIYEERLKDYNKQLVIVNNALHKTELQLNRIEIEMDHLQSKVFEDYQMTYNLALGYKQDIPSIQSINQEIKLLKEQIIGLGNVNIDSIQEFKNVSERYSFLKKQREDLEDAKTSLHRIINEMVKTMEVQFKEHFKNIQQEFNNVFMSLFEGGYGKVYLTEPENPLTSGVEIEVQPPGKKLQNLTLLSGGERALTAIALLFSILKVKPTPFCILDEIEAALDDPNVYRYANFLKDFSKDTQFIAVTHRKGTMEIADTLYGVTMEEQGVSKLVSVRLTELVS